MNSIQSSPYVSKIHRLNASQLSNGLKPSINSSFYTPKSFHEGTKKKDKTFSTPQRPLSSAKRSVSCNCTPERISFFKNKERTLDDIIRTNKSRDVKYFAEMIQMLSDRINRMEMGKSAGVKRKREKDILSPDFETPKKLEKVQDNDYYPTVNCDYSTDVESDSDDEENNNNNNNNEIDNEIDNNKKSKKQQQQQQQPPHSPYRHIEKIFKDYEKVQKEFSELNKRLQSKSCTKEEKTILVDRIEELTALTQSLQEEYKLSIKWNKEHGLPSEGITDKNNTPIDKNNNNKNNNRYDNNEENDNDEEDNDEDDNYRTISDITDDLNQVDVLYNSFKETLKKCKVSNWSRNMLHILQKRFDDLTEELNHTKLHIKSDMKFSEHSINNAIELLNQLDYLVRSAERIHNNINNLGNNKDKGKEEEKDKMKKIYVDINKIVKSLLACEDIQNTEFITVVQGISSNIKSISPAYDILKESIMKLKKLLESNNNNNNNNNQSVYDSLKFNNNYSYNKQVNQPSQQSQQKSTDNTPNSYSAILSVMDTDSIAAFIREAERIQKQYKSLKNELNGNPSPDRVMEIQSILTDLMERSNNLENKIAKIRAASRLISNNNNNEEEEGEEEEGDNNNISSKEFTIFGITKRLTVLTEKYDDLLYRMKNCKNEEEKEKIKNEINVILKEANELDERISQMKPEEKRSMKNQLQTVLIGGARACKEECSGREEKYGFLTDYYKKFLPVTSDKMLKEFVDLGMQLCSSDML